MAGSVGRCRAHYYWVICRGCVEGPTDSEFHALAQCAGNERQWWDGQARVVSNAIPACALDQYGVGPGIHLGYIANRQAVGGLTGNKRRIFEPLISQTRTVRGHSKCRGCPYTIRPANGAGIYNWR